MFCRIIFWIIFIWPCHRIRLTMKYFFYNYLVKFIIYIYSFPVLFTFWILLSNNMLTESETLNSHIKTYPWHLYSMVCCNSWSPSELALEFSRLMNIMLKQTEEGSLGSRTSGNKYLITSNFCKYLVPLLSKPQCSSDLPYWHSLTIYFFFFTFQRATYSVFLKRHVTRLWRVKT